MVGTVNAGREHFEAGVRDMAQAETQYPGWLGRPLTDRLKDWKTTARYLTSLRRPTARSRCSARSQKPERE
jgi:hypothetical protein